MNGYPFQNKSFLPSFPSMAIVLPYQNSFELIGYRLIRGYNALRRKKSVAGRKIRFNIGWSCVL